MATAERELRAAQNQMLFRSVNERILELGGKLDGSGLQELDFACECADNTCIEKIKLSAQKFGEIEENENQFIVLRGHELPEVENTIAEHDRFLIVSKRGAGAEFVKEHS
jgi:hypothetical protein